MPLDGVPKCCSGARSRKGKRRHWIGGRSRPPGACCAKATASVRHVRVPSERLAFTCSPRLHAVQVGRAWRCLLKVRRSVALALDHERASDTTGSTAAVDHLERAVPKPLKACRSVALALDHERASDTTGSAAAVYPPGAVQCTTHFRAVRPRMQCAQREAPASPLHSSAVWGLVWSTSQVLVAPVLRRAEHLHLHPLHVLEWVVLYALGCRVARR
jgi:hypothetical protein